mgnify:FL=1
MRKTIIKPYIERAVIEINGGCNYTCQMCPQTNPGRHKGFLKQMKLDEFEKYVMQCIDKGVKVVNLEGSGEATLIRRLPEYIQILTDNNIKSYIFSNGFKFKGNFMKKCIDAGLSRIRFSIIGYNQEKYKEWMNKNAFDFVKNNAIKAQEYISQTNGVTELASYHLITDNNQLDYEIDEYKKNWIEPTGTLAEIWKMHNWSGVYENPNERAGKVKTCGRPFAPEITIRAGGLDGKTGAIHPCCQVLGRDEEAVLGHLSENTFDEVWNGEEYQKLREGHITGNYPSYCKGCDFLIDDPEVLVYTNHNRTVHTLPGTDFTLESFR